MREDSNAGQNNLSSHTASFAYHNEELEAGNEVGYDASNLEGDDDQRLQRAGHRRELFSDGDYVPAKNKRISEMINSISEHVNEDDECNMPGL